MLIWDIAVWLVLFALLLGLYFTVTSATWEADGEDSVPKLICKPSALSSYLTRNCKSFWLCPRAGWPHLQTLYSSLWPGPGSLHLVREHLQMSDGGVIGLDWAVSGEEEVVGEGERRYRDSPPPILLLIPNSLGAVSGHCRRLLQLALRRGYRPLLFNRRLHNSVPLTSRRLLPFGDPSDLREAVSYIRYKHPLAPLFAASESSGSALLLSYLGECGSSSYMTAAACISPILRCQHWLEDGLHGLYHWFMLCYQKTSLS
eukprot:g25698.t1